MKKLNDFIKEYGDYIVKDGDAYWVINVDGRIHCLEWDNCKYDITIRNQGNVFLTKEEAEYEVRRREVYSTVKRYAYEFSDDEWNNFNMRKYYLYYDYRKYFIDEGVNCRCRHGELYFKSEADIEKAIEAVGMEDFKKYYLGVKE